ncbi:MAG: hypothetical protein FDZ70_03305 [Actinobacteria bacterium]|nr:MAG: hypothetical protein FDZ70_03305 [Actinomycetota bacterium]
MVTLTFPGEGVHDYDRALRFVQDFLHDHGHKVHHGQAWIAVPELHPGGHGWHWHILVPAGFSKDELSILRVGWTAFLRRRAMPPSGGARFVRVDLKLWGSVERAATYAAKYAGKTFDGDGRGKGRKRYLVARGLEVAIARGGAGCLQEVRDAMGLLEVDVAFESKDEPGWRGPPVVWCAWRS